MADDRAVDAELEQHRRRDLAGERPLDLPVDVLRGDGDLGAGERLHRRVSEGNGGQTATSTPSTHSSWSRRSRQNDAASSGPLYIFQLPAISIGWILRDTTIA